MIYPRRAPDEGRARCVKTVVWDAYSFLNRPNRPKVSSVSEDLITTTEAARVLGVGPSTIKRWADDGILSCVRTAGGHRRFIADEVQRFKHQGYGAETDQNIEHWLDLLTAPETDAFEVNAGLLQARGERTAWWEVCTSLAAVLEELGTRWARGELSVAEEHVASERLARGLAYVAQSIGLAPRSPTAVLVTAEGDDHTLGLAMAEVCCREAGWGSIWLGRSTPISDVVNAVEMRRARLVGVSASAFSSDPHELVRQEKTLGQLLAPLNVPLILGGTGAWPDQPTYGERIADFRHLSRRLTALRDKRR